MYEENNIFSEMYDSFRYGVFKIVSVSGYLVSEYIVMIIATYVLIIITCLSQYMVDVIEERRLFWTTIIGVSMLVSVFLLYLTNIRIGIVMLLNGIALGIFIKNIFVIVKFYFEEEDGQERIYQ